MYPDLVVYERDKLYEEVWAEPVVKVAEHYGVSGTALAKTCRKLDVPLPPRGYWAKIKAGKTARRTALPKLKPGAHDRAVSYRRERPERPARPPELDSVAPVPVDGEIIVTEVLTDPHPLVTRTKRHLEQAQPGHDGLLPWTNKPCLDISVTPASLDRALRIADALLKSMETAGLRVEERIVQARTKRPPRSSIWESVQPGDPEVRVTRVLCDGEWLEFAIAEKVERQRNPKPDPPPRKLGWDGRYYDEYVPTTYTYVPTGRLSVAITKVDRIAVQTTWNDGTRQRLETRLTQFVTQLSTVAMALKLQREEDERRRIAAAEDAERRRIAQIEEEQRRWARQQHQWAEDERAKKLLNELENWRLVRDIRAYVKETAGTVTASPVAVEMTLMMKWELAWALRYADARDPLAELREDLRRLAQAEPPTGPPA